MFEQLNPDPGERGLEKATRMFHIVAILNLLAVPLAFIVYSDETLLLRIVTAGISAVAAVLAYITARGVEQQRRWAKRLGIVLAMLLLLNVPYGTIIGIAILVYVNRASKAGLLNA